MSVSILCIASTIVGIVLGFVLGRCGYMHITRIHGYALKEVQNVLAELP